MTPPKHPRIETGEIDPSIPRSFEAPERQLPHTPGGAASVLRTADDDDPVLPPLGGALAPGEAVALPPTDETPNDSAPEAPAHIPHVGHALLFALITVVFLAIAQSILLAGSSHAIAPIPHTTPATEIHKTEPFTLDPKLAVGSEAIAFLGTLAVSFFVFPRLWQRRFSVGISWNFSAATRNALRLVPLGFVMSFSVQAASSLISMPKSVPVDEFFRSASDAWIVTAFGTLLAPAFEEIFFRGFLLPAFAIAYDWLSLPRVPAALESWRSSNAITMPALVFSAVFSSLPFALMHGKQISFVWPVILLLFCVSLVLTAVRIRLRSVAASTLVHASYNLAIFLTALFATGGYRHLDRLPR